MNIAGICQELRFTSENKH